MSRRRHDAVRPDGGRPRCSTRTSSWTVRRSLNRPNWWGARRTPPERAVERSGLLAASILENAVNNTSLFFVLDVAGTRFLFPGDAQFGAWEHVRGTRSPWNSSAARPSTRSVTTGPTTPPPSTSSWRLAHGDAMVPYGLVERWKKTIPKPELLAALSAHEHPLVRADQPEAVTPQVTVHEDLWTEISFEVEEDRPPPGFVSDADEPAVPAADTAGATGALPS